MPLAVCATPIGNLDDVTLRLLDELRAADVVLCEDTRVTRVLLERHGISARLLSYHEHNEAKRTAELLPRLEAGERVALVSDAGMPGISDPGARLVAGALELGVAVTVLPGASAVETALVASGFAAERYQFVGFLPRGAGALRALWDELARWPQPAVAVCRELTKKFEEIVRGTAEELAARFAQPPKGEITLVLGAGGARDDASAAVAAVGELVAAGLPRRRAADVVARLTGSSRNELYRRTL